MRARLMLLVLSFVFCFVLVSDAQAVMRDYTYPYDISQIEWQLLNWTAAWRNSTQGTNPYTLERMEYDRSALKVHIYLSGPGELASEENLQKGMDTIAKLFTGRFKKIDPEKEILLHISLLDKDNKPISIEYKNGLYTNLTTNTDYRWKKTSGGNWSSSSNQ